MAIIDLDLTKLKNKDLYSEGEENKRSINFEVYWDMEELVILIKQQVKILHVSFSAKKQSPSSRVIHCFENIQITTWLIAHNQNKVFGDFCISFLLSFFIVWKGYFFELHKTKQSPLLLRFLKVLKPLLIMAGVLFDQKKAFHFCTINSTVMKRK